MTDSESSDSDELTAEQLQERILELSTGDTFTISGVPQFGIPLEFIQARTDGRGFHAIETKGTEIIGHDKPFKIIWSFIIDPERGGPNNGVVLAHSTPDGAVPVDATAETVTPQEYDYALITEFYPRAINL